MKEKRGKHISYEYEQSIIYEYKNNYFVIQEGSQGIVLNPIHGNRQPLPEWVKLYAKLPINSDDGEIGSAILGALDAYDTEAPEFDQFDRKSFGKLLKKWLGARGMKDIDINSRVVFVSRSPIQNGNYTITPFDSFNRDPWCGPMEDKKIFVKAGTGASEIGKTVRHAFTIATHHPDYIDPK